MRACNPRGPLVVYVCKLFPRSDASGFDAFGRILSGTVKPGDKVRVLGEAYTPDDEEDAASAQARSAALCLGTSSAGGLLVAQHVPSPPPPHTHTLPNSPLPVRAGRGSVGLSGTLPRASGQGVSRQLGAAGGRGRNHQQDRCVPGAGAAAVLRATCRDCTRYKLVRSCRSNHRARVPGRGGVRAQAAALQHAVGGEDCHRAAQPKRAAQDGAHEGLLPWGCCLAGWRHPSLARSPACPPAPAALHPPPLMQVEGLRKLNKSYPLLVT